MYRVIGKRPHMTPAAQTVADAVLGAEIGANVIGLFLCNCPDGVIVESAGNYYETNRGRLVGIDPHAPGEMVTTKAPPVYLTAADCQAMILEAGNLMREMVNTYGAIAVDDWPKSPVIRH